MVALASLVVVLFLSLIIVRVAAVALTLTGLSREVAGFQARSAWTGTGFTTAESEQVMSHPVRRRIVSLLILARNAGLITVASTLVLSFVNVETGAEGLRRLALLVLGLAALLLLARSEAADVAMSRVIAWALKRYTTIDTRDYAALLHLAGDYAMIELTVPSGHWLAGRTLAEVRLPEEGVRCWG